MSVMACDRFDCDNIMCNRYSNIYGYICSVCYSELVEKGGCTNITDFMQSSNNNKHVDKTYAGEMFNSVFRRYKDG